MNPSCLQSASDCLAAEACTNASRLETQQGIGSMAGICWMLAEPRVTPLQAETNTSPTKAGQEEAGGVSAADLTRLLQLAYFSQVLLRQVAAEQWAGMCQAALHC